MSLSGALWHLAALAGFTIVAARPPAGAENHRLLDPAAVDAAVVSIRRALPEDWEITEIARGVVPLGWAGEPRCALVKVEDTSISFRHEEGGFLYHPFYRLWFLPLSWEGRGEVAPIGAEAPLAVYLGENQRFRVLHRTLGRNTWPEGREVFVSTLELESYPLTDAPRHALDVGAMQRLFRRLEAAGAAAERWQPRIYGIIELPRLIYVELLTWEEPPGRRSDRDRTFLGRLAERETRYLVREILAAFPRKRAVYLRRVTNRSFSDVLVGNPIWLAAQP